MSDPQQAWPHYYDDAPQRRCVDDPTLLHEGNEVDDCEGCTPVEPTPTTDRTWRRGCRVRDDGRPGACGFEIHEHTLSDDGWICPPWRCLGKWTLVHETRDDVEACVECMGRIG